MTGQIGRGSTRFRWFLVVLTFSVVGAAAVSARVLAEKHTITHDEGITFLVATCHQGSFNRADFGLRPVPASAWKRFLQVEDRFCYGRISADLAALDIHPPLYFWLLHSWYLVFGVEAWTGPALNILLAAVTTLALFGLARFVLQNDRDAALVAYTYALSPAVYLVSVEARQYVLLALCAVLLVWQTWRCVKSPERIGWRGTLLLALAALAGALTHYHFVLVVTGCMAFAAVRQSWKSLGAILVGYGASFVMHPALAAFQRHAGQTEAGAGDVVSGWARMIPTFDAFIYLAVLLPLLAGAALLAFWARRDVFREFVKRIDLSGLELLLLFPWIGGALVLMYMVEISQAHAIGPKYLSMAWPFLAFAPVAILRLAPLRGPLTLYFYLVPFVLGFALPLIQPPAVEARPIPAYLRNSELLLIDSTQRGIVPPIVWLLAHDKPMIVADQDELLRAPQDWLPSLKPSAIYLSQISHGNTRLQTQEILTSIRGAGYEIDVQPEGVLGLGLVFVTRWTSEP